MINCDNDCKNCMYPECLKETKQEPIKDAKKMKIKLLGIKSRKFLNPEGFRRDVEEYTR